MDSDGDGDGDGEAVALGSPNAIEYRIKDNWFRRDWFVDFSEKGSSRYCLVILETLGIDL